MNSFSYQRPKNGINSIYFVLELVATIFAYIDIRHVFTEMTPKTELWKYFFLINWNFSNSGKTKNCIKTRFIDIFMSFP